MRPKFALFSVPDGLANVGWFRMLNASARNWIWCPSVTANSRISAESKVKAPGPCKLLRPAFPNVPGAFAWKADLLNHAFSVGLLSTGLPTTLGRSAPTPLNELSRPAVGLNQYPVRLPIMPETSQPPSSRCAQMP